MHVNSTSTLLIRSLSMGALNNVVVDMCRKSGVVALSIWELDATMLPVMRDIKGKCYIYCIAVIYTSI